jgi:3-phenylpropionate/trans-cinnamate dioxygenase ferredoxin reductase component
MSQPPRQRVVIVGAGGAGDAAAVGLRKLAFDGSVTLIGIEDRPPYERPYLSKEFLRSEIPEAKLPLRSPAAYEEQDITVLTGRRVVEADRSGYVVLEDGERVEFDALVLATGATPRWPDAVPHTQNALTLRSFDDCVRVKEMIRGCHRLLLLGMGFIGAEVAASARQMGKDVLAIERGDVPLERALGAEMGAVYADLHRSHGVDLRTQTEVTRWISKDDRLVAAELSDGRREEFDAVLLAIGVAPEVGLAEQLGLKIEGGGVAVDDTLCAAPNIFCAGDIASHFHPIYNRRLRVEHWQVARKHGGAVARAIVEGPSPYAELPWFWSDQYDTTLNYLGSAPDFDQVVWRGQVSDGSYSLFYLRRGVIDAVLSVNDGATGRQSRELIRDRVAVDAKKLADVHVDLRELGKV